MSVIELRSASQNRKLLSGNQSVWTIGRQYDTRTQSKKKTERFIILHNNGASNFKQPLSWPEKSDISIFGAPSLFYL
jgi:hypothetical protein